MMSEAAGALQAPVSTIAHAIGLALATHKMRIAP
jgi:hypothetical protein